MKGRPHPFGSLWIERFGLSKLQDAFPRDITGGSTISLSAVDAWRRAVSTIS
jgi:hypothetical protein